MMWKIILWGAVRLGHNEWARSAAKDAIANLRRRTDLKIHAIASAAGIAVPAVADIRQGRIIRTRTDSLKPDQVVLVDGQRFRIARLISSSALETVYEADQVA